MFAIVEIAGLQYKVEQDQKLFVNRLKGDKGTKVSFDKVLLTVNGSTSTVGAPAVNGIVVDAEILEHVQADKVIVFKKKRRKGYAKKNGHRQQLTQIVITGITGFDGAKKSAKKETAKTEETEVSDRDTVNFSQDYELNYKLKKYGLSQTKENREVLVKLADGKNLLSHAEVDALIEKNKADFKELKK